MTMPPVLLAHGVGSSFQHNWVDTGWVDILDDLGRSVIAFELPGHGDSGDRPLTDGESPVSRVFAAMAGHGTVDAVGFSAGAATLLAAACADPGRFRRLALLGLGDGVLSPDRTRGERLADVLEAAQEPADLTDRVFWRLPEAAGNTRAGVAGYLRTAQEAVSEAAVSAVTAPVLLVLGERDFVAPADRLRRALPNATLVTLPKIDHFATTSDFGCIEAVTRFLSN
jgi:pimeloyl-ACP methyl ester carboxylesterase